ncbi:MgtC/SapB family protein [Paenibacillus pabuli]|uniref:MgtC/SapB family protein n=1 Tax=Paenibacillus pabuli TaxID=1472 RepID=UPI003242F1B4
MTFLIEPINLHDMTIVLLKLLIISIVAIVIGLERENKHKPLGTKTLSTIGIVSCLLTMISIESVEHYMAIYPTLNMDPFRLPAQVVSGIGFLGAGAIFIKSNNSIVNLTTASLVWGTAMLGIAVGAGFILETAIAFSLILLSIKIIPWTLTKLKFSDSTKKVAISLHVKGSDNITEVLARINSLSIKIDELSLKQFDEEHTKIKLICYVKKDNYVTDIYRSLIDENHTSNIEVT